MTKLRTSNELVYLSNETCNGGIGAGSQFPSKTSKWKSNTVKLISQANYYGLDPKDRELVQFPVPTVEENHCSH